MTVDSQGRPPLEYQSIKNNPNSTQLSCNNKANISITKSDKLTLLDFYMLIFFRNLELTLTPTLSISNSCNIERRITNCEDIESYQMQN